jgi:hypothetical protein
MNDQRCMVCKYLGDNSQKELSRDRIYRERGSDIMVLLCYGHSWELFLMGQNKFLAKYRDNFLMFYGTESENELIDYVRGGSKKSSGGWAA